MIKPGIILLLFAAMIAVVDVAPSLGLIMGGWLGQLSFFDNTALVGPGLWCVEGLGGGVPGPPNTNNAQVTPPSPPSSFTPHPMVLRQRWD